MSDPKTFDVFLRPEVSFSQDGLKAPLIEDAIGWLSTEHQRGTYTVGSSVAPPGYPEMFEYVFRFTDAVDAVMFKLRWA